VWRLAYFNRARYAPITASPRWCIRNLCLLPRGPPEGCTSSVPPVLSCAYSDIRLVDLRPNRNGLLLKSSPEIPTCRNLARVYLHWSWDVIYVRGGCFAFLIDIPVCSFLSVQGVPSDALSSLVVRTLRSTRGPRTRNWMLGRRFSFLFSFLSGRSIRRGYPHVPDFGYDF